jgi:hypothetical protein
MKMHLVVTSAFAGLCSLAFARYDGGDTWSALEPKSAAPSSPSLVVATTAPLSTLRRDYPSIYGSPAEAGSAGRIVRVSGSGRSINVAYGETVTFVVNGENGSERSFAWRFDVSPSLSHVDLDDVAPAGLTARNVRVFVAPDSRYAGGRCIRWEWPRCRRQGPGNWSLPNVLGRYPAYASALVCERNGRN